MTTKTEENVNYGFDGVESGGRIMRSDHRKSVIKHKPSRQRHRGEGFAYHTGLMSKHMSSSGMNVPQIRKSNSAIWMPAGEKSKSSDNRTEHDKLLDYLIHINTEAANEKDTQDMIFEEGFGGMDGYDKMYWAPRLESEERQIDAGKDKKKVRVLRTPDNTIFTHANERLRKFFELGGYRAFPEVVTVSIDIREILHVDTKDGNYRVSFIATTRWYDAFFDQHQYFDQIEFYTTTKPYITFDHVDEGDDPNGVPLDAANLTNEQKHSGKVYRKPTDPPGVLYFSQRIQSTFRVENNLHSFPFDIQRLSMNVRLWGANQLNDVDHGRILLPLTIDMKLAHRHLEWTAHQATSFVTKRRFDRQDLQVDLTLKRRATFFIQNVYVILFSMPTMSFFAFAVPGDGESADGGFVGGFEARCQITLTLMLTSVAYKFYLEGMLPKAPYLTLLDSYIYSCFGTICLIFLANTVVLIIEYYQKGESNSYDIHLFSSSDSGASLAVFWDNMLFYVLFAIWIVWNVRVMIQARRVYRAINDNPVGRVGSDLEKASIKKKKDAAKALDKEQDVLDGTNKPKFTGREARVEKDISTRKKKKDDLKLSITRYPDDQKTLRLRRAFVAADYMEMEKVNTDKKGKCSIGPKGIFHCKCKGCEARRAYKAPAKDIITLCLAAGIDESRAGGLSKQFESFNISSKTLKSIYNGPAGAVAIQTLLQQVDVGLEDAVMIMAALGGGNKLENDGEPSQVLAMQGSSSYLMLFLKLDGKLVAMPKFKSTLVDEIKKLKSGSGDHDFTNAANVIFAHSILQSTIADADYVYSQRTFEFKDDSKFIVASQVWSGYLVDRSRKEWSSGGAIGVDIGTGKMAFGYAERGASADDGLPSVKSIDLSKFESSPDAFFEELERAIAIMDVRTLNHAKGIRQLSDIDQHETDTDRLNKICEPLLNSLEGVCAEIKKKGVTLTGEEPIFFFGTMKMRDWLKEQQAKHGGRCREMLAATAKYMEMRLPSYLPGVSHKVHFDICPQELEAKSEHLAFKLALKWGNIKEEDSKKKELIEKALAGDNVGNLAWGNGSMQGFPDGSTYVNAELGLKEISGYLKAEVATFGSIKKLPADKKGKQKDLFTFGDKSKATEAIERTMRKTMRRLMELAPRLPMATEPASKSKPASKSGGSERDEEFGFMGFDP